MPSRGAWRHFDPMPPASASSAEPPSPSRKTAFGRRGKNIAGAALSLVALVYLTLSPSDGGGSGNFDSTRRASPGDNIGRSRKLDLKQVRDLTDEIEKKSSTPWLFVVPRPWLHDQLFQYASALGMWIENGGPLRSGLCIATKAHHEDGKEYADYLHEYIWTPLMPPCRPSLSNDDELDGPFGSSGSIVEGAQMGLAPYVPFDLNHPSYKNANTVLLQHVHLRSHKYFDKLPMKSLFEFRRDLRESARQIIDDARGGKENAVVVGIHVSFAASPGITKQAPEQFYELAMSYFMGKDGVIFVVTSDNMELAKSMPAVNRPNVNVVFAPDHQDPTSYYNSVEVIRDVATLAAADHVIASTGSTGWWGGYLGEGTVVAYQDVFAPALQNKDSSFRDTIIEDYFPPAWILVGDDFIATTGILNADRRRRAAVREEVKEAEARAKKQEELGEQHSTEESNRAR